jgi:hypothetical protein
MIPSKGQKIIELIQRKRYHEAFGIAEKAITNEINVAHIRLSYEFKDYPTVQTSLNIAKGNLLKQVEVKQVEVIKAEVKQVEVIKAVEYKKPEGVKAWLKNRKDKMTSMVQQIFGRK